MTAPRLLRFTVAAAPAAWALALSLPATLVGCGECERNSGVGTYPPPRECPVPAPTEG